MKKFQRIDLRAEKGIFLFLDFDGTLASIVGHPKDATIMPDAKKWLRKLLKRKNIKIAIVTGRSLSDIRHKAPLQGLYHVANHGAEISHKNRYLLKKGRQLERPLDRFGDEMRHTLAEIPGIFVEKKGLSVAIHFRLVEKKYHGIIKRNVRRLAAPLIDKYGLQITKGKMILELRPALVWNKGKAVKWLWEKVAPSYYPIYIGDDITDEDAFKALGSSGLTIRIGKKTRSYAQYFIPSIKTIIESNL